MPLLEQFEELRRTAYAALTTDRGSLGQFYTPAVVAALLASMLQRPVDRAVSLIDPGAGVGMLSAAAVSRLHSLGAKEVDLTVCEVAPEVLPALRKGMEILGRWCQDHGVSLRVTIIERDFVDWAVEQVSDDELFHRTNVRFDVAILNPPYKKINTASLHRKRLRQAGLECTNLYAAFIYLSAKLLRKHGELISISPRSFANGPYFRDFRRQLFTLAPLHAVHVFERRDRAFSDDNVLQENIVLHAVRGEVSPQLRIQSSEAGESSTRSREVSIERAINPKDPDSVLHIEATDDDTETTNLIRALPATLSEIGIQVSTGRVVDFRARDALSRDASVDAVPLIYPQHVRNASVVWPKHAKKPDYFRPGKNYTSQLVPAGIYVLTKRFTSKEEQRRITASLISKKSVPAAFYAFENHLNYFHAAGAPLDEDLAAGLVAYLNSTLADRYFRLYNGHTQVNASDLRAMPYPSAGTLRELGRLLKKNPLTTENVDPTVTALCRKLAENKDQGIPGAPQRSRRTTRAA